MALQNRVTPFGVIIAIQDRGTLMGNRGRLHDDRKTLQRPWAGKAWICCETEFRGRSRRVMTPGLYTELFFLDEAVALAAGHRPCFTCRREDARAYADGWGRAPKAPEIDRVLHEERLLNRGKRIHLRDFAALPDGAFVERGGAAWLVRGPALLRYSPAGYDEAVERPVGTAKTLTPPATLRVLATGYSPRLHPSAEIVPMP